MIRVINHSAKDLPKALLLNDSVKDEVIDMCVQYHNELSITVIIERVQNAYGLESMVFASFVLGQLAAISQNKLFNLNLLQCQKEN